MKFAPHGCPAGKKYAVKYRFETREFKRQSENAGEKGVKKRVETVEKDARRR
jgi:hypothetical protein